MYDRGKVISERQQEVRWQLDTVGSLGTVTGKMQKRLLITFSLMDGAGGHLPKGVCVIGSRPAGGGV